MKSTTCKLFVMALCCLLPITAFAGGGTGWMKIQSMQQRECMPDKGLEISFTTVHANPDVCSNARTIEVSCSLPTYKVLLAMALTAQSAGMEVNGFVHECDAQGQAKLRSLQIRQ
jgi:hypothetical protein